MLLFYRKEKKDIGKDTLDSVPVISFDPGHNWFEQSQDPHKGHVHCSKAVGRL